MKLRLVACVALMLPLLAVAGCPGGGGATTSGAADDTTSTTGSSSTGTIGSTITTSLPTTSEGSITTSLPTTSEGSSSTGEPEACVPGQPRECYRGPADALGVGACVAGSQICQPDGNYGPCAGDVLPGVERCDTPDDENCDGAPGCSGTALWSLAFPRGEAFGDLSYFKASDVVITSASEVWVTGDFIQKTEIAGVPLAAEFIGSFLAKFGVDGAPVFVRRFGGGEMFSSLRTTAMALNSDGNVVIGGYYKNAASIDDVVLTPTENESVQGVFVAAVDSDGDLLWVNHSAGGDHFGDHQDQQPRDLLAGPDGQVVVVGGLRDRLDFGGPSLTSLKHYNSIFAVALDRDGGHLWSRSFSGTSEPYSISAYGATRDDAGSVWITGNMNGDVDFGDGPWTAAQYLTYILKLDAKGQLEWSRMHSVGNPFSVRLAPHPGGGVYFGASFQGPYDLGNGASGDTGGLRATVLAELDATGAAVWHKQYDQGYGSDLADLTSDTAGYGIWAGVRYNAPTTGFFTVKVKPDGTTLWSQLFVHDGESIGSDVAVDPGGRIAHLGNFYGTLDVGAGPMTGPDGSSFVALFRP